MSKAEKKEEAKADKAELSPEEEAAKSKKKKLLIMIIGGVLALFGIGGGVGFFLASGSSAKAKSEKSDEHAEGDEGGEHGEKKDEHGGGHGEKKDEHGGGHGEKKDEHGGGHGEKKDEHGGGHGEKKDEHGGGHGEKKDEHGGGHGEKKDEHGGGHGEKKDEHGGGGGHGGGGDAKAAEKIDPKTTKVEGVDFGCTANVPPFHLNLGNPLENHYMRLEIAVEYDCEPITRTEIDKRLPQLRDVAIAVVSRKTREFLLGPDGKNQLRKELYDRINQYMNHKIDAVYITDILIE
ncbi:MAG: flagellar basal body-associated FliL family protein [Deltaproteobacteria bacterium]|nr:flagellar basal body-associated FliL family protein [Deltaproteobacteria bacterium]